MPFVPSLVELSFQVLLTNVNKLSSDAVAALPEHVQLGLFDGVLGLGKLNEALLDTFMEAARCSSSSSSSPSPLEQRIRSLNIRPLPPRPPATRTRWLGENPTWY